MTVCDELADYEWLTGSEAGGILADLAERNEPLHLVTNRLRRLTTAARAHLLLEQIELRGRAAVKFSRAAEMFFTRVGLEQATDEWTAGYKASRFGDTIGAATTATSSIGIADLCCGIGGDLLALAAGRAAVGIDRDVVSAHFAAANARLFGATATVETVDVEQVEITAYAAWHIDPDRRPSGKRTSAVEWSSPSRETVERLLAVNSQAAIKLAPAAELPAEWLENCECEWISRDRQCRQLVAWFGNLAKAPGKCRATVLAADGRPLRSVVGEPRESLPIANDLARYVFEPDTAVLAAKLPGALAAEHQLAAVSAGIPYLTGPNRIQDAALACFEVDEVLPLQLKKLAAHLRSRNIGQLEIKKRGVDHEPEKVRKQLALNGDIDATLLLTKLNGKHVAILARRCNPPAAD
jgi:hypothetical protein